MLRVWHVLVGGIALCAGATYGHHAMALVADAYPNDAVLAETLSRCVAGNPSFVRFSAHDRDVCYLNAGIGLRGMSNR